MGQQHQRLSRSSQLDYPEADASDAEVATASAFRLINMDEATSECCGIAGWRDLTAPA
jgi:hypothetical protein